MLVLVLVMPNFLSLLFFSEVFIFFYLACKPRWIWSLSSHAGVGVFVSILPETCFHSLVSAPPEKPQLAQNEAPTALQQRCGFSIASTWPLRTGNTLASPQSTNQWVLEHPRLAHTEGVIPQ